MRGFLVKLAVNTVALLAVVHLVPGISAASFYTALAAAFLLGAFNAFLRPVIILFTLPINILSLGIFTLFINGFMLYLVSRVIPGFTVNSFSSAFFGSILLSVISFLLSVFFSPKWEVRMDEKARFDGQPPRYHDVIDVEKSENKEK